MEARIRNLSRYFILFLCRDYIRVHSSTFQVPCQYLGSYGTASGDSIARDVCPPWSENNTIRMYYFAIDLDPGSADQVRSYTCGASYSSTCSGNRRLVNPCCRTGAAAGTEPFGSSGKLRRHRRLLRVHLAILRPPHLHQLSARPYCSRLPPGQLCRLFRRRGGPSDRPHVLRRADPVRAAPPSARPCCLRRPVRPRPAPLAALPLRHPRRSRRRAACADVALVLAAVGL